MREIIPVSLGERSYEIHVGPGLLAASGGMLAPLAHGPVPVVTDETVAALHLPAFTASLAAAGIDAHPIILPPGEGSKSFTTLAELSSRLLALDIDRSGLIVALGGGVIGDLTGFAAAILKRGISFAQVPTTLLSQVDSSVGGKTGINTPEGKNLIGAFHQPRIVLADTDVLNTLPRREKVNGYAEVAKYGALGDFSYFTWLEEHAVRALDGDGESTVHMVAHACRMKAAIVAKDEREGGIRALLNLGHTFGHALETATGFSDRLKHGEGVAVGMALAFKLAGRLGICPPQDGERFIRHLQAAGLPVRIGDIPGKRPGLQELLDYMHHDKKVKNGKVNFVLPRAIGDTIVTDHVPPDILSAVLATG